MKRRPLASFCMVFLMIQILLLIQRNGEDVSLSISSDLQKITGVVYRKSSTSKTQVLYLRNSSIKQTNLLIYDDSFTDIPMGKTITFMGIFQPFERARNPGNFDAFSYYQKQHIVGSVWCEKILEIKGETDSVSEFFYQIQNRWTKMIYQFAGQEKGGILAAMLIGEKAGMDAEIKELYQKSGISHILAISGLHISFIGLGIYRLLRKTGMTYLVAGILSCMVLSAYVMMLGFAVSVIRAYIMLLVRIGADITGRVYDMMTALFLAAAITVLYQPLYLTDAGFLLSYGAIIGILFLTPAIEQYFPVKWKCISGTYASIGIQIVLLPVTLWFFYEIPTYAFFLNLLVIPLTGLVLGAGMLGSVAGVFIEPFGRGLFKICILILSLFESGSTLTSMLPMSRVVAGKPWITGVMLYYMILILLVVCATRWKQKKRRVIVLYICSIFVLFYRPSERLEMMMIDVGQGDCIYFQGPSGKHYLVDGGSSDVKEVGKYRIEPCLKSLGVKTLHYVFVTHGDLDHYSGIEEMIQRQTFGVKIKTLVFPVHFEKNTALIGLAKLAIQNGITVVQIQEEDCIQERGMTLTCLQPGEEDDNLEDNAGSMVLDLTYKSFSMLLTGDVEEEGEAMLEEKIKPLSTYDVLKVAHHGSGNSTMDSFLDLANPSIALISCGEKNRYGHPHDEVLERLQNQNSKIYRTDLSGAIQVKTNGKSLTIKSLFNRLR